MAKVNDLLASVTLKSSGGYGGKKLYVVGFTVAGNKYLLAHTDYQAGKMATEIAVLVDEVIATPVALAPVYVQEGFTVA